MVALKQYDYIFAGAGCASLSLLIRMISSGHANNKRILLIDREAKKSNDRTWCFWETGTGFFEDIVFRKWSMLDFYGTNFNTTLDIRPYEYKMIRGSDFYSYCFEKIRKYDNIEIVYGELNSASSHKFGTTIVLDGQSVDLDDSIVFNSIPRTPKYPGSIRLLQHFKGWVIDVPQPVFDPGKACLMDFRVHQDYGTAFVYLLPFSNTRALIEYTLFTRKLLEPAQYDKELRAYILDYLKQSNYSVVEEEFGVIPMTNERTFFHSDGAFQIGAAGGQTKSSSGYTFQFIQKHSQQIVDHLVEGYSLTSVPDPPKRFRFYDNTLLYILYHKKLSGKKVFTDLFRKNKPQQVLRFLDNESSFKDELKIISSLPTWPFLKAALAQF